MKRKMTWRELRGFFEAQGFRTLKKLARRGWRKSLARHKWRKMGIGHWL